MPTGKTESPDVVNVGLTEAHGMARELQAFGSPQVRYSFLKPLAEPRIIRSPIKGYMRRYDPNGQDLIEAVLSPVVTASPWIYSCENLQSATAFSAFRCPLPRSLRIAYIRSLLMKRNCKKVVFWSEAGRRTLHSYGNIGQDDPLLDKVTVVYPAIRKVDDDLIQFGDRGLSLLFSGDFFRKGGVNVVDAFERLQRICPSATLTLCCDERINFTTPNVEMRTEYLNKIAANPGIRMLGRISREELLQRVLPQTDIYLLPTYIETFGMSVLEAMGFGIPVIATNHFAIPEMLEDDVSGILIDTSRFDADRLFVGYVVNRIPQDFRDHVTDQLFAALRRLSESADLRKRLGLAGLRVARTKFSFDVRNARMQEIYREALA